MSSFFSPWEVKGHTANIKVTQPHTSGSAIALPLGRAHRLRVTTARSFCLQLSAGACSHRESALPWLPVWQQLGGGTVKVWSSPTYVRQKPLLPAKPQRFSFTNKEDKVSNQILLQKVTAPTMFHVLLNTGALFYGIKIYSLLHDFINSLLLEILITGLHRYTGQSTPGEVEKIRPLRTKQLLMPGCCFCACSRGSLLY